MTHPKVKPDLEKLRRFALTIALILIGYMVAGVRVKDEVQAAGLGLRILRPELVPLALVLASAFVALRFCFYAFVRRSRR